MRTWSRPNVQHADLHRRYTSNRSAGRKWRKFARHSGRLVGFEDVGAVPHSFGLVLQLRCVEVRLTNCVRRSSDGSWFVRDGDGTLILQS